MRKPSTRIRTRDDALLILKGVFDDLDAHREHLVILGLDEYLTDIGFKVVASGTRNTINVEPQTVIEEAVRLVARGIVVAHNHPSARRSPTKKDRRFGRELRRLARNMRIKIHDQIILHSRFVPRRTARPWTDAEVGTLLREIEAGTPLSRIARIIRRCRADIHEKAEQLAVPLPGQKSYL